VHYGTGRIIHVAGNASKGDGWGLKLLPDEEKAVAFAQDLWDGALERRKFTREFKLEAVRLIKEREVTVRRPRAIWVCMGPCSATG
jgi:hypothetical protein